VERGEARGGEEADGDVEGEGGEGAEDQEEDVLQDDGLLGEAPEVGGFVGRGSGGGFFDARPGEVDVEEEEEDAEADNGALGWLDKNATEVDGCGKLTSNWSSARIRELWRRCR